MTKSPDAEEAHDGRHALPCPAEALAIIERLRAAGHEALLVGGCVRDFLMGIAPKDWDIATSAPPEEVERLFEQTVAFGKAFGVILVVTRSGSFEVATFRGDRDYVDGRRPSAVFFTGAEEDVKRRDFTINALLYDPFGGRVIDYVGGRRDLSAGLVRTVGDPRERFREDSLRLLRAVRFAARTGFRIEAATFSALCGMHSLVRGLAFERVGEELFRMVSEGYAACAFRLMDSSGLLADLLPEVAVLHGVPQPPEFHPEGDVWSHVQQMLVGFDQVVDRSLSGTPGEGRFQNGRLVFPDAAEREILGWSVLLHDVGKARTLTRSDRIRFHGHDKVGAEMAGRILERLRRPGHIRRAVMELVGEHMRFIHIRRMRTAKRRRFVQGALFPLHLALHRIDCLGSHRDLSGYEYALGAWQEEQSRPAPAKPLLSGRDLIAAGYAPGPRMGAILRAADDARLEGEISTRVEALAWVREHFPLGGQPF